MTTKERVFLREPGVSVTNSRFIAEGQTYAMSGITSVMFLEERPKRLWSYILGIVGAGFLHDGIFLFGALMIFSAVGLWFLLKSRFSILLRTASGESKAMTSTDDEFIERIVEALNEAIIHRG